MSWLMIWPERLTGSGVGLGVGDGVGEAVFTGEFVKVGVIVDGLLGGMLPEPPPPLQAPRVIVVAKTAILATWRCTSFMLYLFSQRSCLCPGCAFSTMMGHARYPAPLPLIN